MPGDLRIVGERGEIADDAIVRDVRIGQEQVPVADRGVSPVLRRAGVDRCVFAEDVVVADRRGRRLAAVFAILRYVADRGELEKAVAHADCRAAGHDHMRANDRSGADHHVGTDDRKGTDGRVGRDVGGRVDQRSGVDVGHGAPRHPLPGAIGANVTSSSASAASSPPTEACTAKPPLPSTTACIRDSSSSWSPGDT